MNGHRLNVMFRADASAGIGIGHLMRCLSLADELARHGAHCLFACASVTAGVAVRIAAGGHELLMLDTAEGSEQADAAATVAALSERDMDWLVVDHYRLGIEWESYLRPCVGHLAVIDDLANKPHHADLLLNQNAGADAASYRALLNADCRLLLGPMHALLRPEFAAARQRAARPALRDRGLHLVVTMGGTDPRSATVEVLSAIQACALADGDRITVVLGSSAACIDDAIAMAAASRNTIRIAVDVTDMAGLLSDADIAIAAAGSTLWELCCLGIPTIAVITATNQQPAARALSACGAILLVETSELVSSNLPALVSSLLPAGNRQQMSACADRVTDGLGSLRVATELINRVRRAPLTLPSPESLS